MATIITNVTQLQDMESDLTADYELGSNIDASATSGWNGGLGFDPIGDDTTGFTGSFDGKGFTINDLFINRPTESFTGLFGRTGNGVGTIQDVGLVDCDITGEAHVGALIGQQDDIGGAVIDCYSTGSISANEFEIGGLIGDSYGTLTDCYSTCSVTAVGGASDISEVGGLVGLLARSALGCYATGDITITSDGDIDEIGGLVGLHSGYDVNIEKCYSTGDVSVNASGRAKEIGGLVGADYEGILNCYARGDVAVTVGNTAWGGVGGFIGAIYTDDIDDCFSTGLITATGGMPNIGGFCGLSTGVISNCFWDTQTSGQATSDGGTGKTTAQMKTKATFTDAGWDFVTIWGIVTGVNDGYPSFTLAVGPTVTTQECTNTIADKTTGHGTLTNKGDSEVTEHGHVWATLPSPTTADSKTENGAKPNLGQFQSNITSLTPSTLYYVAAYVTNTQGTSYGDDVTVTTLGVIGRRHWWTEGPALHYFDEFGVERKIEGTTVTGIPLEDILTHLL